jgi:hypothetical protein
MEDVVMTDLTKEDSSKKDLTLYSEFKRILLNIDKAISLKDTKAMSLNYRLLNKFRREFTDEDISYLVDTFLRSKNTFAHVSLTNQKVKNLFKLFCLGRS